MTDKTRRHTFEYRDKYTESWEPCPSHVQSVQQAAKWYCSEQADLLNSTWEGADISADFRESGEPGYVSWSCELEVSLEWLDRD